VERAASSFENPAAVTRSTEHAKEANAFLRFLTTPAAQQIFANNGYRPVVKSVLDRNRAKFPVRPGQFTIDTPSIAIEYEDSAPSPARRNDGVLLRLAVTSEPSCNTRPHVPSSSIAWLRSSPAAGRAKVANAVTSAAPSDAAPTSHRRPRPVLSASPLEAMQIYRHVQLPV
jgi:hypothetical protein